MSYFLGVALFLLIFLAALFFAVLKSVFSFPRISFLLEEESEAFVPPKVKAILQQSLNDRLFWKTLVVTTAILNSILFVLFLYAVHYLEVIKDTSIHVALMGLITVVCFVVLGEVLPRTIVIRFEITFVEIGFAITLFLRKVLYPFLVVLDLLDASIKKIFRKEIKSTKSYSQEIDLAKIGLESIPLPKEEKQLLTNVLDLRVKPVRKVMIQRNDIVGIMDNESLNSVLSKISKTGYSRLPYFEKSIDNVLGFVHAKSLVVYLSKRLSKVNWKTIAREPIFVPETQYIDDVLMLFQKKRVHIAIVIDEFGSVSGLITLEDILDELLENLSKQETKKTHRKISDYFYWFDATIPIEEVVDILNFKLPKDFHADTLGGFVLALTGDIPKKGETLNYDNFAIKIDKTKKNRIESVFISINNELNN